MAFRMGTLYGENLPADFWVAKNGGENRSEQWFLKF
jgi:hypothetical protein